MKTAGLAWVMFCGLSWAQASAPYFPIKTKAGEEGVSKLEAERYGRSLEQMEEPRLVDKAKEGTAEPYRLLILPTWGNAIAVRVERIESTYQLAARRLEGQTGFETGKLVEAKDVELGEDDSKALTVLIDSLNFFELPTDDDVNGGDGDDWILEGVSKGRYHVVQRWSPSSYDSKKRNLKSVPRPVPILAG